MRKSAGIILIALCGLCWIIIPIIPFLQISLKTKSILITSFVIAGEIFFYVGLFFIGKSLWIKYKDKIKMWFKFKNNKEKNENY